MFRVCHTFPVAQSTFSVASVNVNGIRAAFRKGMQQWLDQATPDVLLLQEIRAEEEIAQDLLGEEYATVVAPSRLKGRAGVAVAVRKNSTGVGIAEGALPRVGLLPEEVDVDTGRWIELDLVTARGRTLQAVSAYFHAGQVNHPKQDAKMRHLSLIDQKMRDMVGGEHIDPVALENPQMLLAGDFNIVRSQRDIKNWKGNYNRTSGVLDEEMAYLNRWVSHGWSDVVRDLAGEVPGPYSWWSWRGRAFDNDTGWRIDYHFVTPLLAESAVRYRVDRARSWDTRFSDHAPVVVEFEI